MITEKIKNFRTIDELQKYLINLIDELKRRSEEFSKTVGDKMRSNDSSNTAELQELRQKIEGTTTDPKKKKSTKKKDSKTNWYNFDSLSIYDGIGIKGELELYFKALERIKSELEMVTKVKQTVDNLVSKDLKRDMGCILVLNHELPAEIAFTSATVSHKRYSFKAIFNVPLDEPYAIKI